MVNLASRARAWAANLGLALASLAVGMGLIEIWARHEAARLFSQIRSFGELVRYSPTLGWDKPPGEETVYLQPEYQVVFRVNSRGLRGPERDYAKPPGVTRVLLLGDSFVEGYTVGEEAVVSAVLEARLNATHGPRYEVINGGTHGYGTDQEYLFFLEEGRRYQPDVVVLFFYSNDLPDNMSGFEKPFFEQQGSRLVLRNSPVPPPPAGKEVRRPAYARRPIKPYRGSYALRLLGRRLENASPGLQRFLARIGIVRAARREEDDFPPLGYGPEKKVMWQRTFGLIESLADAARGAGARFVVFYVPARFEVNDAAWELTVVRWGVDTPGLRPDRVFSVLQQGCAERDIELVDPRAALRLAESRGQPAYFVEDAHWSEVGHRIAAEALVPVLRAAPATGGADAAFLVRHGYAVLFAVVLLEQLALPLPVVPFFLAAGALAGLGQLDFLPLLLAALLACVLSDAFWFELGRRRGMKVLSLLCRLSLEPDSCVRRTEDSFARHGPKTLLLAKFLPGLNTVAAPMAGMIGMGRLGFHGLAGAGALLWASSWMAVGWIFRPQLDRVVEYTRQAGVRLGLVIAVAFLAWLAYKWDQRRRFLRKLWIARVDPLELKRLMDAGEQPVVVDLRGRLDFEADPVVIPGAMRLDPTELEERDPGIPREREIVLYCT